MVLAASTARPAGVSGISLFIVPKFWVNADGTLGARNDVHCLSIEHKLGIHASPTCVMVFGENEGALGHLVRRARTRPRIHVRDDEQRAPVGGDRGVCAGRARVPAGGGVGAHARAGQAAGARAVHGPAADHRPPGREADAAAHEVHGRGLPRARAVRRLPARSGRAQRPTQQRARRAGTRRPADAHRQGLLHRDRHRGRLASASRCTAAWASSRKPAQRSTCATCASRRSTRAPPASSPTTSSAASSAATAARRWRRSSRTCSSDCRDSPRRTPEVEATRRAALEAVGQLGARHPGAAQVAGRRAPMSAWRSRCRT